MKKQTGAVVIVFLALVFASVPSRAQSIRKSALSGQVISTTNAFSGPAGSSAVMYTPSATGFFYVTQVCISNAYMEIYSANRLTHNMGDGECRTYEPGFVVAPGEQVTCYNTNGAFGSCTLIGVQSPK